MTVLLATSALREVSWYLETGSIDSSLERGDQRACGCLYRVKHKDLRHFGVWS